MSEQQNHLAYPIPEIQHLGMVAQMSELRAELVEKGTMLDPANQEQHKIAETQTELLGNQLASYGADSASKDEFRVARAWKMAQTREGGRIDEAATEPRPAYT